MQSHPSPSAHVCTPIAVLQAAEAFIAGFDDAPGQAGIAPLLWDLRAAMRTTPEDALTIAPRPFKHLGNAYATPDSDFAWTAQGNWHRMRAQREYGWTHEPCKTFVRANWYDHKGGLWQRAYPAVTDDFGNLVEVGARGGAA